MTKRCSFLSLALALAAMACAVQSEITRQAATAPQHKEPAPLIESVELEGRIVCIPERIHERFQTELPFRHEHVLGFEKDDGALFTLLRTKFSEALYSDERLRQKRLLLKGHVFPRTQVFEVTRIRSIRNGIVHDLFYYCEVCSIETVTPGECACCQGTVELVEKPLAKSGSTGKTR